VTIESMVAEEDRVAVRLAYSGTDAATGERATWPEMVFTRFSAGKAVESWALPRSTTRPGRPEALDELAAASRDELGVTRAR
jgi:SnoaL-like polyketide cyclase